MKLYFRDNFFNAGVTEIVNEAQERLGEVDLRSMFGSGLDVFDETGRKIFSGGFPLLSGKWVVSGPDGAECGLLRARMAFFSKRYEYEAYGRGVFEITAGAFSKEYQVIDEGGSLAASFSQVNGVFASAAYCLISDSITVSGYEWVVVILGMNEIEKRRRSVANTM